MVSGTICTYGLPKGSCCVMCVPKLDDIIIKSPLEQLCLQYEHSTHRGALNTHNMLASYVRLLSQQQLCESGNSSSRDIYSLPASKSESPPHLVLPTLYLMAILDRDCVNHWYFMSKPLGILSPD